MGSIPIGFVQFRPRIGNQITGLLTVPTFKTGFKGVMQQRVDVNEISC